MISLCQLQILLFDDIGYEDVDDCDDNYHDDDADDEDNDDNDDDGDGDDDDDNVKCGAP